MSPRQVTIKYCKPGVQPPVFVAGSFSEPAWHPEEMDYEMKEDGNYTFEKPVHVEDEAEVQYKFRIGLGDQWDLNSDVETVHDDQGNVNNIMRLSRANVDKQSVLPDRTAKENTDDHCPMFAYECLTSDPDAELPEASSSESPEHEISGIRLAKSVDDDDFSNPRLEHFPSNSREAIFSAIQHIERNTEMDSTAFEGVAHSPVISVFSSDTDSPPELKHKRLDLSRPSPGPSPLDKTSSTSLHSIPESLHEPQELDLCAASSLPAQTAIGPESSSSGSMAGQQPDSLNPAVVIEGPSSSEDEGISMSIPSNTDCEDHTLRKRLVRAPPSRPVTPASMHSVSHTKNESWLQVFCKTIFRDWLGALLSKLFRGSSKT